MLFNLALEVVIRKLRPTGHVGLKLVQICGYADDLTNKIVLSEIVVELDRESLQRGLKINKAKTKYMEVSRDIRHHGRNIQIGQYTFEHVEKTHIQGQK